MKSHIQSTKIYTDENLMESIQHGTSDYHFHFYNENLAQFDFHCVEWHWHTEFEFVFIKTGEVTFWVGDTQFHLHSNQGIFMNSKILHRLYSPLDAMIPNFLCLPSFLSSEDSLIYHKYVQPFLSSTFSHQIFDSKIQWQAGILEIMEEIIDAQNSASSVELTTSFLMQKLWLILSENIDLSPYQKVNHTFSSAQARLQIMMQYIHMNYRKDISLDYLASQAMVSKSTALNLFRQYLNLTPISYLIFYRLKEAAVLLCNTEKKINTISDETGFHNVDYFCRIFKKHYNVTPTEYRKKKLQIHEDVFQYQ